MLGRIDVALVTGDARAQHLAREFGFTVIEDTRNESETAAIEMATAWCEQRGYDTTVVVPGDIPLITSDELHRVLDAAPAEGAVFVPAYDRRGSNCILRRPASLIPLRFGNDSFLPHCEAMRKTGKELVILEMPGIGLDIDNPHELDLLLQRDGNTNAQRLLRSWGFGAADDAQWEAAVLMQTPAPPQHRRTARASGAEAFVTFSRATPSPTRGGRAGARRFALHDGDILVVKHKIVSKAEGRTVALDAVKPSAAARKFAADNGVDARVVELALREAKRVVRKKHILITETQHGLVCANSGVDVSNVDGGKTAVLLPADADRSAAKIHKQLKKRTGLHVPVDHCRQLWAALARRVVRSRHRRRGDEGDPRLSRQARSLRLQDACHGRGCGRRIGLRRGPGVRQRFARSGLYNPGLSVPSRGRARARQMVRPAEKDLFR